MHSQTIGVAVIGAGYWGPNLVRNAMAIPALDLRYLCDLDPHRARAVLGRYSTVRASGRLDEVLADPAVDAVAVATPAGTHYDVVMAALEAGKHVLVEKPLAASLDAGRNLVAVAAARDRVLMLDHTYCYSPAVTALRRLLRRGDLGELQFIDSVRINLGLVAPDIDVVWDLAPHDLSILDSILPDGLVPVAVAAHGSDPIGAGHACVAHLTVQLSNGAMAHVHVNWLSPTKVRTTIVGGSKRTVVWDDLHPAQRLAIHDRGVRLAATAAGPEERAAQQVSYRVGDMVAPALPEGEALRVVMAEFADAIRERRAPMTDGHAGLRVLAMLEAASISLRSGGTMVEVRQETADRALAGGGAR